MAKSDSVFIYIGTYLSEASARADYDIIKDLHAAGGIGTPGDKGCQGSELGRTAGPEPVGAGARAEGTEHKCAERN